MSFRVSVDKETCIGCGACTSVCDNFRMVDGKSQPIEDEVEDAGCNEEARAVCPVAAISVDEN